ncbi:rod shape-determining protein MreC [Candidatus Dojkabacteria bacterium]|nr:rod shape-determining protein MreC [Candidatus Dojkabacteria bacterium]
MNLDYLKSKSIYVVVGIVVSFFMLLLDGMGILQPVYSWGNFILEPFEYWSGRVFKGVNNTILTVVEIGSLRSENSDLKIENAELKSEVTKLEEIEKENETLREQVGIDLKLELKLRKVRILGVDSDGLAEHIIIDAGNDEKVEKGDALIVGNVLVGEVRDVYKSTSRVRLVSNQKSNIIALDQDTRARGLVRGSLEGVVFEEVLENEKLEEGDTIITWSDDFPEGLVIGKIRKIEVIPTSSTKRAYLETGVNFENLNYAFVVINF